MTEEIGSVPVVGRVDQHGNVRPIDDKMPDTVKEFVAPPPAEGEYQAYRIEGGFNFPAFEGDVIYAGPPGSPEKYIGQRVVALMTDGSRKMCTIARGSAAGLYMLIGLAGGMPISDAEVASAAPILWVRTS